MTLDEYISAMRSCSMYHLKAENSLYGYTKEGHLKYAREVGYALKDFDKSYVLKQLGSLYSRIYVINCCLKPILDSDEWYNALMEGFDK